jgi:hypothetical protein
MDLVRGFNTVFSRACARPAVASLIAVMIGIASPAAAAEPSTRVVRCGEDSCLQITGRRDDPALTVSINGRTVAVEGERSWRVHLPVETVREWSAPYARTIEVSQGETSASVDLPIGLLGGVTDLSSLVISVH